ETQRAGTERPVERRQAAQRSTRARDARRGAVVATGDLRQPLRAGGAARSPPILVVLGLAHDLRDALLDTRLLLAERTQLPPPRLAATLQRLIDRPLQRSEHTFVCYQHHHPESVPSLCRNAALSSGDRLTGRPRRDR